MNVYERFALGVRIALTLIVLGALMGGGSLLAEATQPEPEKLNAPAPLITNPRWQDAPPIILVPCPTEDSANCYWDASVRGNTLGRSFVNIDGVRYFKP